jgi:uncharacterized membrane protein
VRAPADRHWAPELDFAARLQTWRDVGLDWLVFSVQWLHVLLAILWFGNSLSLATVTIPALGHLPLVRQQEIGAQLGRQGLRVFDVVAPIVILLGVFRGTVFGQLHSVNDVLGTTYGLTWLVAMVVAVLTFLWGRFVIFPATRVLATAPVNADGSPTADLNAALTRAKLVTVLELAGFLVVFTCMILMRFGL